MSLCIAGCSPALPPSPPSLHPERILWLPVLADVQRSSPGAAEVRNGRSVFADGSASVVFTASGTRGELSTRIVQHFTESGWTERRVQYLNPQFETSFLTGWRDNCACVLQRDGDGRPITSYFTWEGEWERDQEIVVYDLLAAGERVRGFAEYVPARLVAETRRKLHLTASR